MTVGIPRLQAGEEVKKTDTYQYQSDFALKHRAEGKAEGKAEGEAQAVLVVLEARGLAVSAETRRQITSCTDLDRLETWLRRAATIESADELFD